MLLVAALLASVLAGCRSKPEPMDYYDSFKSVGGEPVDRGSAADPTRRRAAEAELPDPSNPGPMHFLVVHDVEGKPVYVELQRGSGNPDLDRRARLLIIREYRFRAGQADTVAVTVEPREVPRQ